MNDGTPATALDLSSTSNPPPCIGSPLSWLLLEQYHLGELDPVTRGNVDRHLRRCEACRTCMHHVQDRVQMKPLHIESVVKQAKKPWHGLFRQPLRTSLATGLSIVAVTIGLYLLKQQSGLSPMHRVNSRRGIKGSGVTLSVVRNRKGVIRYGVSTFLPEDRFKVAVTCRPGHQLAWDLVVIQSDELSFPLQPRSTLSCGNRVALPGSFRLSGSRRTRICLVTDMVPIDRKALGTNQYPLTHENSDCVDLSPGF